MGHKEVFPFNLWEVIHLFPRQSTFSTVFKQAANHVSSFAVLLSSG